MRGIKFKIPDLEGSFISEILNGICVEQYVWKISEDQVYLDMGKSLFLSGVLNGQDFRKTISYPSYYVVFANLQAYPTGSDFKELNTHGDFLKSGCEIAMFISDSIFVDIYAKDEKIINKIKYTAEQCDFKEINYITDENDRKTEFCAM